MLKYPRLAVVAIAGILGGVAFANLDGSYTIRVATCTDTTPPITAHGCPSTQRNDAGSSTGYASVPAPVVGAELPSLVAACGGLLVLARRRRQRQIA